MVGRWARKASGTGERLRWVLKPGIVNARYLQDWPGSGDVPSVLIKCKLTFLQGCDLSFFLKHNWLCIDILLS